MISLHRILSPTDFSAGSRRAAEYAGFLARKLGAELHLLHAVLVGQERAAGGDEALSVEQLLERQAESLQSELGAPAIELRRIARRGYSAGVVILEYAAEVDADLIVLGTHRRRGAQRLLLGSVAEEVVRYANCPVLTVRETVPT